MDNCTFCKKEIEKDSLFTQICKECSGQNKLIRKERKRISDIIKNMPDLEKNYSNLIEKINAESVQGVKDG